MDKKKKICQDCAWYETMQQKQDQGLCMEILPELFYSSVRERHSFLGYHRTQASMSADDCEGYYSNDKELTEHGAGPLYTCLTEKGEEVLEALQELFPEGEKLSDD